MSNGKNRNINRPRRSGRDNQGRKPPLPSYRRAPFGWLIVVILAFTAMMIWQQRQTVDRIEWNAFEQYLQEGQIESMEIGERQITGKFRPDVPDRDEKAPVSFAVDYQPDVVRERLFKMLDESKSPPEKVKFAKQNIWLTVLLNLVLPILIVLGFLYFIFARNLRSGAGGMLMSFGRSRHRLQSKDRAKVTFKDVAGVQEAKEEVNEIIAFLKNPKKFQRLGGRIPRGVLLVGPPGCGKTLLAKAIAGEADVPFFSISGSDFVEMFVGVGASRVRDLFRQAKENSPCIIFLDEVDAIGRKRGPGFVGGGHDEREQT